MAGKYVNTDRGRRWQNADGTYAVLNTSSYLTDSTTYSDADSKLDAKIRYLDDMMGHGITPTSEINHKLRLDNHDVEDGVLHDRINNTNTDVARNLFKLRNVIFCVGVEIEIKKLS